MESKKGRSFAGSVVGVLCALISSGVPRGAAAADMPGGELRIVGRADVSPENCPLEHTDVAIDVAGFVASVRVRQEFTNPTAEKIEAVYVFPLPEDAAVDAMVMTVGDRRVVGRVKPRDEAREVYEKARAAGHVASLLDQERPNVFTQSVANIEPGARVAIEITYVQTLRYDDGRFELVFPMVVGPHYMPGSPIDQGKAGTGWAPDTDCVPDGSRVSPHVAAPGTRAGHDIALEVNIDAGSELYEIESELHEIDVRREGTGRARVSLRSESEIPNRDFILRYRVADEQIGDAFLVDRDRRGTYFTLVLQPPRRVAPTEAVPKEMIFVIDRSGSMEGFQIEKAKAAMRLAIEAMNPNDTFNLLSFAGGTGRCFPAPVPNTAQNRDVALQYLADLRGEGGTEMMSAIADAFGGTPDPNRVRVVAFMTDGYIGNDFEIIDAVAKSAAQARVFAFGIGNAVNRFLLDGMARAGRGEVEYVTLESDADQAVHRFEERIQSPVLTDVAIDWGTLPIADVYPKQIPDLFSAAPVVVRGRLTAEARGTIVLRGHTAAGPFERRVDVDSDGSDSHDAIASLWARAAVEDLLARDYAALQRGNFPDEIRTEVTRLGVDFHLVTQFTSFVAVEEKTVTEGGLPRTVEVPVEMPSGVSRTGVFGEERDGEPMRLKAFGGGAAFRSAPMPIAQPPAQLLGGEGVLGFTDRREAVAPLEKEKEEPKLAAALRTLAADVSARGKDGDLTAGALVVRRYQVEVAIRIADHSDETLRKLADIGFTTTAEREDGAVLVGTIDVRKLEELAHIDAVARVEPATAG